jgi:beta-phosphoglucomutase
MGPHIEAFIFDVNGVISSDTAEYHFLSWQQLAREEGISFDRDDNERLRGVSRWECLRRFLKGRHISTEQEKDWLRRKDAYFQARLEQLTPANRQPGIERFLSDAGERGIKLGIASASRNARTVLEKLDLLDFFMVIGDATTGVRPKPAPDLFIWVAGYLHVEVRAAVVFEDAETGIQVASEAGFWTVGIGNIQSAHVPLHDLQNTQVAHILERIDQLHRVRIG